MTLHDDIHKLISPKPFTVRYEIHDFRTSATWSHLPDEQTWSASTRKVAIMMACFSHAHKGRVDLGEKFSYSPEMGRGKQSGTFRFMSGPFDFTLTDAVGQMMITSDNVCTELVYQSLGETEAQQLQAANDYCRSIGMSNTVHRSTWADTKTIPWHHGHTPAMSCWTTVRDQVYLLKAIVQGAQSEEAASHIGVTSQMCQLALSFMSREYDAHFKVKLPLEAQMASKGGRGIRGRTHVGVALKDREPRYAIAVYTDWVPVEMLDGSPGYVHALETMASINRIAWDYLVAARSSAVSLDKIGAGLS